MKPCEDDLFLKKHSSALCGELGDTVIWKLFACGYCDQRHQNTFNPLFFIFYSFLPERCISPAAMSIMSACRDFFSSVLALDVKNTTKGRKWINNMKRITMRNWCRSESPITQAPVYVHSWICALCAFFEHFYWEIMDRKQSRRRRGVATETGIWRQDGIGKINGDNEALQLQWEWISDCSRQQRLFWKELSGKVKIFWLYVVPLPG